MDSTAHLLTFVKAQDPIWEEVCAELQRGRKTTHWMWFVFPQLSGLGHSHMSRRFAINSRQEAQAYLAHPVLGCRLRNVTTCLLQIEGQSARQIFGSPDDIKLHSCMTLFASVESDGSIFHRVLQKYFDGKQDAGTLERLTPARSRG